MLGILDSRFGRSGMFLAVDVKSPKGKLSPHREAFLKEINDREGLAIVVRSVEDFEKALNDFIGRPNRTGSAGGDGLRRAAWVVAYGCGGFGTVDGLPHTPLSESARVHESQPPCRYLISVLLVV
jgi:hypothetical protein